MCRYGYAYLYRFLISNVCVDIDMDIYVNLCVIRYIISIFRSTMKSVCISQNQIQERAIMLKDDQNYVSS